MMDWTRGYTSRWKLYVVDPDTWADAGEVGLVSSVALERDEGKDTYESGSAEVTVPIGTDLTDQYYRLVLYASQGGTEREEIGTMLCTDVSGVDGNGMSAVTMELSSVLYPASVKTVPDGTFLPRGADGPSFCEELLSDAISAPVERSGSFAIANHYVFDRGASVLDVVKAVLAFGGYRLRITAGGTVQMVPRPVEPQLELVAAGAAFVRDSVPWSASKGEVPNHYIAVDGAARAEATNDDPTSPTSTVSRGYTKDAYDSSPQPLEGETLAMYAARKLEEASVMVEKRTYDREWMPDVCVGDMVYGGLGKIGLVGSYRIVRQSVRCSEQMVLVQETAQREVQTWRA